MTPTPKSGGCNPQTPGLTPMVGIEMIKVPIRGITFTISVQRLIINH